MWHRLRRCIHGYPSAQWPGQHPPLFLQGLVFLLSAGHDQYNRLQKLFFFADVAKRLDAVRIPIGLAVFARWRNGRVCRR